MHNQTITRLKENDKDRNTVKYVDESKSKHPHLNDDLINPFKKHEDKLANYFHTVNFNYDKNIEFSARSTFTQAAQENVAPFFSMRKLRLIYNQLKSSNGFEYGSFDAFKHHVLNTVAPHLELNKWQSIAARR